MSSATDVLTAEAKRLICAHGSVSCDGVVIFTSVQDVVALVNDARSPLVASGLRAAAALQAAAKITRGAGSPKTADVITAAANELTAELRRSAGEAA